MANKATKAAKKNKGLLGGAARSLSGRQSRIERALARATGTKGVRIPGAKHRND